MTSCAPCSTNRKAMAMVGTKTGVFLGAEMGRVAHRGILFHYLSSQGIKRFENFALLSALPTAHTPSALFTAMDDSMLSKRKRHLMRPVIKPSFQVLPTRSVCCSAVWLVGCLVCFLPRATHAHATHAQSLSPLLQASNKRIPRNPKWGHVRATVDSGTRHSTDRRNHCGAAAWP